MRRILFLLLLFSLPLAASFEVKGASLYWRPCGGTFVVGTAEGGATPRILNTDYDWGYRVGAASLASDKSCYVYGHYTHFKSKASANYGELFTLGGLQPGAHAERSVEYDTGSAGIALAPLCLQQCVLYVYGGPRYLDVEDRRKINATEGVQKERFAFTGYGGEFGCAADATLRSCAGVHAHLGGLLLVGEQRTRLNQATFPGETTCVFGIDVKVATTYTLTGRDYCLTVEAGYDLALYFSLLRQISQMGFVHTFDVGFHGPYTGLRLQF
ncbi:MAG: hypothetical protein JSR80_02380 [Verrucomicrobia bacterium]|nr:hypothetical protein [Verrucomicrobiota bacterium]